MSLGRFIAAAVLALGLTVSALVTPAPAAIDDDPTLTAMVEAIHRGRDGAPVWIVPWEGPGPKAWVALELLARADLDGLPAGRYLPPGPPPGFDVGPDLLYQVDEAFDRALTRGVLQYIIDVRRGLNGGSPTAGDWRAAALELGEGLATEDAQAFRAWLEGLRPGGTDYAALRAERGRFLDMADEPWSPVAAEASIKPGEAHDAIPAIRERLRLLGDLSPGASAPDDPRLYDPALEDALRAFQTRHGLEVDGVIGRVTRGALDLSPADRARLIGLNMERLRWLDGQLTGRHVVVNVAGFELTAVDDHGNRLTMPVIVGKRGRRTPVMTDTITEVTFRPTWTVPTNIARDDLLPKIKRDPGYFADHDMVLFESWAPGAAVIDPTTVDWSKVDRRKISRYKMRQNSGPTNALGLVRFTLNNPFDIYLHDSPTRSLFHETERTFSSGCIRVAKPFSLARFVLSGLPEWTDEAIAEAMRAGGGPRVVRLPKPIPVHVIYATAWVAADGTLNFRNDVYGRDAKLLASMNGKGPS